MTVGLFPGQGIDAGSILDSLTGADDLMAQAHDVLGFDLDGTVRRLARREKAVLPTSIAQPSIFVASLAGWNQAVREGLSVDYLAGHSLGEYAALVAGGALTFRDGLRVLIARAGAMQRAERRVSGGMVAVLRLDHDTVEDIARRSGVDVANDNAPGQIVLSGADEDLAQASAAARDAGGRSVLLPVSGPFHSRFMGGAAATLEDALDRVVIRAPRIPVLSNVSARPYRAPGEIRRLLVEQMTGRVRFREALEWAWSQGVRDYRDLGPGNVVGGLARRTFDVCAKSEVAASA